MSLLVTIKKSPVVHLMLAIVFFTSGLIINFFQCILYICLRPFSKFLYRKINYYLCYSFYSQVVFLAEWWAGADLILYMDKNDFNEYCGKEHGYLIMNHSFEIDWLIGWIFCDRVKVLGNCKAYAKKSIQYIPTLGWAWKFAESIFLERNWDKDKETIGTQIEELANYPDPIWLLLYAEGTRFTPEKAEVSQKFAKENNLPVLKHHLSPRTKGFTASIPHLRKKVPAIYDIQLAFKSTDTVKATVNNFLAGNGIEGHMCVRRIPMKEVPEGEEAASQWLHDLYKTKDQIAESFTKTGDFFATSGVHRIESFKLKRRIWSLVNTLFWSIVVLVPMVYYLINLLLSGSTVYFFMGVGIIAIFFILLSKLVGMTEISKSSSYGIEKTKKKN